MRKKILSIILSVVLALSMMPAAGLSFTGEANTTVPVELVKAQTSGTRAVKLSWNKVSGATKYVVYGQKCDKSIKKLKTTSSTSYVVKKIKGKKLKAHKDYKFYVTAYSGSKKLVSSKTIHFITAKTYGKYANASGITAKYRSKTLAPGKKLQLGATVKIYKNKKHLPKSHGVKLRYTSNNPSVASVNANGIVTAKLEGTAKIYIQDLGGLYAVTEITVKQSEPSVKQSEPPVKQSEPPVKQSEPPVKQSEPPVKQSEPPVKQSEPPEEFTVTFNMHGHGTAPADQNVVKGSKATEPENAPSEEGYTFGGWYTDDKYGTEFDFGKEITEETTIHAKWTAKTYKVTVSADANGTLDPSISTSVSYNTEITATGNKLKLGTEETTAKPNEGYQFDSWTGIPASGRITEDTDVKAIFKIKQYTVSFDLNGHGAAIDPVAVDHGDKVTKPTAPTAEGYTFGGWYKEAACTNAWNFDSDTVKENTTLYAKWIENYKDAAKAAVLTAATSAKTDINNLIWLSESEKAKYEAAVNKAVTEANEKIAAAKTIKDAKSAEAEAEAKIVEQKTEAKAADAQAEAEYKNNAKSEISAYAASSNASIDDMDWLTEEAKSEYKTQISSIADEAKAPIEAAATKEDTDTTKEAAKADMDSIITNANDAEITITYSMYPAEAAGTITNITEKIKRKSGTALGSTAIAAEDYVFVNWTQDGNEVSANADFVPQKINGVYVAATYTANFKRDKVTVTFDLNGKAGTAPSAQTVAYDGKVTKPTEPTAEGSTFGGWYKEAACTNAWNFDSDTVKENTTLYAKWTENYKVAAKAAVLAVATSAKTDINNLIWLSKSEKPKYEDAVNKAVTEANEKIDAAKTIEDAKYAEEEAKAKIVAKKTEAKAADAQAEPECKNNAKNEISVYVASFNAFIDDMDWLTEEAKSEYKTQISNIADEANVKIAAAETIKDAKYAEAEAKAKIVAQKTEAKAADAQAEPECKNNAKNEISVYAASSNASIDDMDWLTEEAKSEYKTQISNIADEAKTLIDAAATKEDTDTIKEAAEDEMDIIIANAKDAEKDYSKENGYMVCIWDMELSDIRNTVTFGPATGETDACLSVNNSDNHSKGKHCIAKDSWEEISTNIEAGHADYYSDCLESGCTHNVALTKNSYFGEVNEQCSALSNIVDKNYKKWNNSFSDNDCESSNYATSRIRATLNGKEGETLSIYAGDDCLTEDECLLSCFPKELRESISLRTMTVPTRWQTSYMYDIQNSIEVSDKLWLPNATEIFGYAGISEFADYGIQFKKKSSEGTSSSTYSKNKLFDENGSVANCWMRSPYRVNTYAVSYIYSNGGCNFDSCHGSQGLAPCFNISGDGTPDSETYTVTFNMNGHGTAPTEQKVEKGSKAARPENDPTAEGYEFGGWYKEAACTNAWNFDLDTVTSDTTIYAKWTSVYQYNLANDGNGAWKEDDKIVSSITVLGEAVPIPGETITYTGIDGTQHIVKAIANEGYKFEKCTYESKTFKVIFKEKSLNLVRIDFDIGYYRYYPVFDRVPEGVKFYGRDGIEYSEMDANIAYALVPEGVTIKTLRVENDIAWNAVFYVGSEDHYPCEATGVNEGFANNHLVGGDEANEQFLRFNRAISGECPTYNGVRLTDIWRVYNPNKEEMGFGGSNGTFWSDTADSSLYAFCWNSSMEYWSLRYRDLTNNCCICISREFTA